jgi:hypothetical protein
MRLPGHPIMIRESSKKACSVRRSGGLGRDSLPLRFCVATVPAVSHAREPYTVYVDEAGDRGWGGRASPVFVLSAVVLRKANDTALRAMLDKFNGSLGRLNGHTVHWSENLRDHAQRKHIARQITGLPVVLINMVLCKDSLIGSGTRLSDPGSQYNYLVRLLLERVSWYLERRSPKGRAELRFAHVKRFKYDTLTSYLTHLQGRHDVNIYWDALKVPPKIEQPSQRRGLQVADITAGCVYAAVRTDEWGDQEPAYLKLIAPRIWAGPTGKLTAYGLKFIGAPGWQKGYGWLPDVIAAKKNALSGP